MSTDREQALMSGVAQQHLSTAIEAGQSLFKSYSSGVIGQCLLTVFLVGKLKCTGGRPRVSGETAWPRGGVEDVVRKCAHPTPRPPARSVHLSLCVSQPAHLSSLFQTCRAHKITQPTCDSTWWLKVS